MTNKRSKPSLGELADSVLASVEDSHLSKTAGAAYTKMELQTDVGRGLKKLATAVRDEANKSITYADLTRFRKTHGI